MDKVREIVTMLVEPHQGNEAGEVRIYRDELPEGAVVKEDGGKAPGGDDIPLDKMSKPQLAELLTERGVAMTGKETKAELLALAEQAPE